MVRIKIRHYRQLYVDSPDPTVFLSVTVRTSGNVYDDFVRLFLFHTYRETSILVGGLPEESEQFRFLSPVRFENLKGSVDLISTTICLSDTWCVFIFENFIGLLCIIVLVWDCFP